MATETERKFLVRPEVWAATHVQGGTELYQGYLSTDPDRTVRVRLSTGQAWITVKGRTQDISRLEFEYPIPVEDARQLLTLTVSQVHKTRYRVPVGAHTWDVDVFHGALSGLMLAEIELDAAEEVFEPPAWLGQEVSRDARYYNSALSAAQRLPDSSGEA
ncbi:CYTH domain-containing protein [Deinococcus navajonensis]|uniref:CYTH domain-containing protein n=1 Tax=Deinococcus navajonensis TaxID=309884 RepID=A0ABV8XS31_9DEIO